MSIKKQEPPGTGVVLADEPIVDVQNTALGIQPVDNSDYTLSLQNVFEEDLISEFEAEWTLQFNFADLDLVDIEGIIPKRYENSEDSNEDTIYYIYGLSTSDDISRPSFEIMDNLGIESKLQSTYSEQEIISLKSVYEKQDLSDSIKEKVSSISANVYAKMNLNIEQNLNFQKSKVKKIDFKKTSIFEKQPEVVSNETSDNIIITTPTTTGIY